MFSFDRWTVIEGCLPKHSQHLRFIWFPLFPVVLHSPRLPPYLFPFVSHSPQPSYSLTLVFHFLQQPSYCTPPCVHGPPEVVELHYELKLFISIENCHP